MTQGNVNRKHLLSKVSSECDASMLQAAPSQFAQQNVHLTDRERLWFRCTAVQRLLLNRGIFPRENNGRVMAALQEEFLLGALMALAISALLAALKAENGQDYVYACFFLISVRRHTAVHGMLRRR